ncbi:MAG: hypothetical protein ACLU6Y_00345 [Ruminococcus sp.]
MATVFPWKNWAWTSQAVFSGRMLIGPSDEKMTYSVLPSYPYIVVKTEYRKGVSHI